MLISRVLKEEKNDSDCSFHSVLIAFMEEGNFGSPYSNKWLTGGQCFALLPGGRIYGMRGRLCLGSTKKQYSENLLGPKKPGYYKNHMSPQKGMIKVV